MRIILASSSKNRFDLLTKMGFAFEVMHPTYEEIIEPDNTPEGQVEAFAVGKARSVYEVMTNDELPIRQAQGERMTNQMRNPKSEADSISDVLVMGFDSMIRFEGGSIGKPASREDAAAMIRSFVGKPQQVVTGVALVGEYQGKRFETSAYESTDVRFRADITDEDIERYLDFGDWEGKCGAYSILGTGAFFLESINGDFQNIVGVPVLKLGEMMRAVTGESPFGIMNVSS